MSCKNCCNHMVLIFTLIIITNVFFGWNNMKYKAFKRSGPKYLEPFEAPSQIIRSGKSVISGSIPTFLPLIPGPKQESVLGSKAAAKNIQFEMSKKPLDSEKKVIQRDLIRSRAYTNVK